MLMGDRPILHYQISVAIFDSSNHLLRLSTGLHPEAVKRCAVAISEGGEAVHGIYFSKTISLLGFSKPVLHAYLILHFCKSLKFQSSILTSPPYFLNRSRSV